MLDAAPMWLVYVGTIAIFVLALLGLMIAFTFGIAASRLEEGKVLLVDEATAIGTAYLRAGLLLPG